MTVNVGKETQSFFPNYIEADNLVASEDVSGICLP